MISFEEKQVCIGFWPDACSAYIVKRRLIWRLPGVLGFAQDVRAQFL
jgi:hypothetical protein